jgi:hypothetical protein
MGRCKLIAFLVVLGVLCASYADAQTGTSPVLPGKIVGSRVYKNGAWIADTQVLDFLNNSDVQRLGAKVTVKSTARSVNVKDSLANICNATVDGRSTVSTLVDTGGAAAGKTLFIPAGCKILLSNPGASAAAINVSNNTSIECEDPTAGFVLARRFCSTGDTIGGMCDGTGSFDCPSGGAAGGGTCSTDGGLGTSNAVGNAPFAGTSKASSYTVLKSNSGAAISVKNCSFWVNQMSGDYTWTSSGNGNGTGSGKAWGYCEGGTADGGNCDQYCSGGSTPGFACNTDPDCSGGGTCMNTAKCKTAAVAGTCSNPPTSDTTGYNAITSSNLTDSQARGPSGAGKITVIDNSSGGASYFSNLKIYNHRRGDFAVRLGKNSYAEKVTTWANDLTTPIGGSVAAYGANISTNGVTVNTGIELSDNSLVINSDSYGWDQSYWLTGSGTGQGFASVAFSRSFAFGYQNDPNWNGTVGFQLDGLSNAAYFNDIYTPIGAKAGVQSNHAIFKGNNHDNVASGASFATKGPTWIAHGPHNDVELNRSAWSTQGFIYSFGEIRGKCSGTYGTNRNGLFCLKPAGTVSGTLGCPSGTCNPNPILLNAGGGHGYYSNNFLHSDQKGPTASVPGGLAAYVGVTPWGYCDNTSTLPYKTCSTGDSDATTGCPGSSYASAGLACAKISWPDVLFNNNELYALQEGVVGVDLSGATKLGFIGNFQFDGNLITGYNNVSGNTTGFKGPTNAYQLQNANIASHFDRTLSTPISGFDFASGTTQNSTGLQAANDQGTVITIEADAQIPKYNIVQPSTTNSSKVVKTLTTTPGATIGVALNDTVAPISGACTASLVSGTSTYANSTTYYFVYTWATASGETLPSSQCQQLTGGSASTQYIRIVANGSVVPAGAYAMKVYVSTSNGGPYYYSTQIAGYTADTTTPPDTSNATPPTVSTATQVRVMTSGLTNCIAGGTISRGDYLTGDSTTAGRVMTTSAGALPVIGKAAATATSGNTFRCFIGGGSGAIASGGTATALDTTDGTDGTRGFRLRDNSSNPTAPSANYTSFFTKGLIPYVLQNSNVATPGSFLATNEFQVTAADNGVASTTPTDVFGTTFKMLNGKNYRVFGTFNYQTSNGTSDLDLSVVLSNTTSSVVAIGCLCGGGSNASFGSITGSSTMVQVANISSATTFASCWCDGYVKFGTADGTFKWQFQPHGTGTCTLKAGSYGIVQRLP